MRRVLVNWSLGAQGLLCAVVPSHSHLEGGQAVPSARLALQLACGRHSFSVFG